MFSVVVPAYNEESTVERCVQGLLAQLDHDDEVVVVDNDSTDATRSLVGRIAAHDDRVRIVDEPRRGLIPARDRGVAEARGDIVARIDADTVVAEGWATAIRRFFDRVPDDVAGGFGLCSMHDMPFQTPFRALQQRVDTAARQKLVAGGVTEVDEVFGANQVLRKHVWSEIAGRTLDRRDIMEDSDVSMAVTGLGYRLALVPGMRATISGRRLRSSPASYRRYTACSPRTYRLRGRRLAASRAWVGIQFARAGQAVLWVVLRRWDPELREFRWTGSREREADRVIP